MENLPEHLKEWRFSVNEMCQYRLRLLLLHGKILSYIKIEKTFSSFLATLSLSARTIYISTKLWTMRLMQCSNLSSVKEWAKRDVMGFVFPSNKFCYDDVVKDGISISYQLFCCNHRHSMSVVFDKFKNSFFKF